MPLLSNHALAELREVQKRDADTLCTTCSAQIWHNYCRQCDVHFIDGHYVGCTHATVHQLENHRRY